MSAPLQTVEKLNEALETLENVLVSLLEKALSETIEKQDKLEQAKLSAMIPYVVTQLIIIYLRTKGIDPETHHVNSEVQRIKSYFHKIAKAEEPNKVIPMESDQHLQLDKEAANRFIKAALAEATRSEKDELQRLGIDGPTMSSREAWTPRSRGPEEQIQEPAVMHTRFSRRDEDDEMDEVSSSSSEEPVQPVIPVASEKKRKRPAMDPFAGYMEPTSKKAKGKTRPSKEKASPRQETSNIEGEDDSKGASGQDTPSKGPVEEVAKSKNARKKAKKKSKLAE